MSRNIQSIKPLWPDTLRMPASPPKIIYLDLNHWIRLSKALSGRPDDKNDNEILAACCEGVEKGTAVFPLSSQTYVEILKNGHYRQRCDLGEVIEQISRFMVVMPRHVVATHEVEAVLDRIVGPNPQPINTMDYLDRGVSRAFGMDGGISIKSISDKDVTAELRRRYADGPQAWDAVLQETEWEFNRRVIDGPTPDEEPEFREDGWNPEAVIEAYEGKAVEEREQVCRLDRNPRWRRGRLRDVVTARELLFEYLDIFWKGLTDRGLVSLEEIFPESSDPRCHELNSMPSFDVAVTLKISYHRDANHQWTNNDIHDIHAIAGTLPYCDIVVSDKAVISHVMRTGLSERLSTTVLASLSDLPEHL